MSNHGEIVYRDKVSALKRRYLTVKTVDVRYNEQLPPDFSLPRRGDAQGGALRRPRMRFDTRVTPVEPVISGLAAAGSLADLTVSEPSLEDVIRAIYARTETESA